MPLSDKMCFIVGVDSLEGENRHEVQAGLSHNVRRDTGTLVLRRESCANLTYFLAMELLSPYRLPGAELDSSARYPPPRCHPGTRRAILGKITTWLNDVRRDWSMLWLYGYAGIGKSAIAQTVAEHCRDSIGRLGASFFFSKFTGCKDVRRVLPTLAHELAIRHPSYEELIYRLLLDDPMILERDLSSQFESLIARPFSILKSGKKISGLPLLIVLDGLDECEGKRAQTTFVGIIRDYVCSMIDPPLLWMITSRPETHLKPAFQGLGCKMEEIHTDGDSESDILCYLQDGFRDIRAQYWDIFVADPRPWPSDSELRAAAKAASGLFAFGSILLRFVADLGSGSNPKSRLTECLNFLEITSLSSPGAASLHPLDLLYTHVLSGVPENSLHVALRMLGFCVYFPDHPFSALMLCNFFYIDRVTFERALNPLHPVIEVPDFRQIGGGRIRFRHPSFGGFLRDRRRSGRFHVEELETLSIVAIHSLRWFSWSTKWYCFQSRGKQVQLHRLSVLRILVEGTCCSMENPLAELRWAPWKDSDAERCLYGIADYASAVCWELCGRVDASVVSKELDQLDCCPHCDLLKFIKMIPKVVQLSPPGHHHVE